MVAWLEQVRLWQKTFPIIRWLSEIQRKWSKNSTTPKSKKLINSKLITKPAFSHKKNCVKAGKQNFFDFHFITLQFYYKTAMNNTTRIKRNYQIIKFQKLVVVSILIGFLSAFLGVILKKITEHYEEIFFSQATTNPIFFIVFPVFG